MLINKDGSVKSELLSLVRMQGIAVLEGVEPAELNKTFQQEWVRAKDGVLRAQLGGRFPTDEELALLRDLGVTAIHINPCLQYDGTLLLGATMKAIARRMKFTADEYTFLQREPPTIYFLGSERLVDDDLEGIKAVPAILEETGFTLYANYRVEADCGIWPANESEVFKWLKRWGSYHNGWWLGRSCGVVSAPLFPKPDGGMRNPNTAETVRCWLGYRPKPGYYLVVSSQPFCENQKMAVERAVKEAGKEGYTFDVCGPEAPLLPLSRWLDNLAKQLWEEVQLL